MTETIDQLRARRKKDKVIQRRASARRDELAIIGAVAVEAQRNPTEFNLNAARQMIEAFIERIGE